MNNKMALKRQVDPEAMSKEKHLNSSDCESQTSLKKRRRDTDDDDIVLSPEVLAKMSRSERKRHREKKRRSDVNKGFDDLMNLLLEIDPVVRAEAEDRTRRGQWKGNHVAQEDNLLSRVELIGRTVEVLRRVHKENEERKLIIEQLLQQKPAAAAAPRLLGINLNAVSGDSMYSNSPSTSAGIFSQLDPFLPTCLQQAPAAVNGNILHHFAGLASLPRLRADQIATLPAQNVTTFYPQQQQTSTNHGSTFPNPEMLSFANPQMQSLSRFAGAPGPATQGPAPASLLDQLVAERNAAAAIAHARSQFKDRGPPGSL